MKTHSVINKIITLLVFACIIFSLTESYSQQVITFIDGTEVKAFITYQTKDTVKYYLESNPRVVYIETMNHIERISPREQLPVFPSDSLADIYYNKKYLHYKHMTIQGCILFPLGAVIGGIGIAVIVSAKEDEYEVVQKGAVFFSSLMTVVGCVGVIAGIATIATGVSNMPKYKEKLHGFSFDLKYTPQVKGVSVVYRF